MTKGYWIARVDVHNEEGYKPYMAVNPAIFKKFGGRFVVRGGKFEGIEGQSRSRNVVIEFPDYETALACYRSPEKAMTARRRNGVAATILSVLPGQKRVFGLGDRGIHVLATEREDVDGRDRPWP